MKRRHFLSCIGSLLGVPAVLQARSEESRKPKYKVCVDKPATGGPDHHSVQLVSTHNGRHDDTMEALGHWLGKRKEEQMFKTWGASDFGKIKTTWRTPV